MNTSTGKSRNNTLVSTSLDSTDEVGNSIVTDDEGQLVEVTNLVVNSDTVFGFAMTYRDKVTAFKDHTLDYALEYIIARGKEEIKRSVKSQEKVKENKVAGDLIKSFNLSPAEAQRIIAEALAKKKEQAQVTT